ncbi:YceD family protein [Aureivirga sp. CE67]|uniref:YceD family protein n=1 Tax=Aureivirga sp. CE67 TaxID=1788983 RepID=UPI0018CB5D60|nr:DUF177 domain-containing protein [Aureivirga sp. CE67]
MKELKTFNIPFVGLKETKHQFEYQIDKAFFEHFNFDEDFENVDLKVDLEFNKKSTMFELLFKVSGVIRLNCDLTNELFDLEITGELPLIVKFGEEYNDENEEILVLPRTEFQLNVSQFIYELIVLSIPQKRIHPGVEDGTLESDALERLEAFAPKEVEEESTDEEEYVDPRWEKLRKLK